MLSVKFPLLSGLVIISVGCSNSDFKHSTPQPKGDPDKSTATAQVSDATQQTNSTDAVTDEGTDATANELNRLMSASGGEVVRTSGDMGIKPGCTPTQKTVTSTSTVRTNAVEGRQGATSIATTRGWGGMRTTTLSQSSTSTTKVTNKVVEIAACVADRLKTEPFAFCQLKSSSVELVECMNWSSVGGVSKKSSETACKSQADSSSGIKTDSEGRRSNPTKTFFFVCQKL